MYKCNPYLIEPHAKRLNAQSGGISREKFTYRYEAMLGCGNTYRYLWMIWKGFYRDICTMYTSRLTGFNGI